MIPRSLLNRRTTIKLLCTRSFSHTSRTITLYTPQLLNNKKQFLNFNPSSSSSSIKSISNRNFSSSNKLNGKVIEKFLLADIGEGITECEIVKWLVTQDQIVEEFDPIVEVMSDKATVEITSPFSGKIIIMNGLVGDIVKVGGILCEVETLVEGEGNGNSTLEPPMSRLEEELDTVTTSIGEVAMEIPESTSILSTGSVRDVIATPSTRRMARESSVNLSDIIGSGKDGRVTKSDVMAFVQAGSIKTSTPTVQPTSTSTATTIEKKSATTSTSTSTTTTTTSTTEPTILPLSSLRKAMFRAMTSTLTIPHFSYSETIDITNLERTRLNLNKSIPIRYKKNLTEKELIELKRVIDFIGEEDGGRVIEEERFDRITLLPLLIKALSISLSTNPLFTCSLSSSTTSSSSSTNSEPHLITRKSHDISLALSFPTQGGLFTPLLPSVQSSSPFQLASQISSLQSRASDLTPGSFPPKFPQWSKGNGTITLSNVGIVGGRFTAPIIPPTGQLVIGAIGKTRIVPTYVGGENDLARVIAVEGGSSEMLRVEPRLMMDVTFSADHRVVEGVELARLVETWKKIIESGLVV